jgi:hypothetical protein
MKKRRIFALLTAIFILAGFWIDYNLWQVDVQKGLPPIMLLSLLTWIFIGIIWVVAIGKFGSTTLKQEQV